MSSELETTSNIALPELPERWIWKSLLDLVDPSRDICYGIVQPGKHDPNGVPMVNSGDVFDGQVNRDINFCVSKELNKKFNRSVLRGGELLVTLVGANFGRVAVAPLYYAGYNCARPVGVVPVSTDAEYVMFALRSPLIRHLMDTWANTTAQPTLNLKDLANLPVPFPPESEKKAIKELLKSLDDRIALLRETNATLEAIAQALFKSWFVDFDPVHANAAFFENGQAPSLPAEIQALFPSRLVESPQGLIPEGWEWSTIVQSFILTMGQSPPGDTYNEIGDGLPFYQGKTDYGFRFPTQRIFCTSPTRLAYRGDCLVSVRAPVGDVNVALENCALGRGVAGVRHPRGFTSYVLYTLQLLKPHFESFNGEGTVFGSINKKDFQNLPVIEAPESVLQAFDEIVSGIDAQIENNELKLRTFVNLRDTLLPRLISGQLRLPEAEAALAEVK